jgi:hypothetical protein
LNPSDYPNAYVVKRAQLVCPALGFRQLLFEQHFPVVAGYFDGAMGGEYRHGSAHGLQTHRFLAGGVKIFLLF